MISPSVDADGKAFAGQDHLGPTPGAPNPLGSDLTAPRLNAPAARVQPRWVDHLERGSWEHLGDPQSPRPLRWRQLLAWTWVGSVLAGMLIWSWLGLVVGTVLAPVAVKCWYVFASARYRRQCAQALPDALTLMSASLSAGHAMGQAIGSAVAAGGPLALELGRVEALVRVGEPIPEALDRAAKRLRSPDLAWVAIAIRINTRIGGDLGRLLNSIATTLRERDSLRRTARVLSAEGRLSAWVLAALPIGFVTLLMIIRPEHLTPLVVDARGRVLLLLAIILFAAGALWLRRAIRLEV